MPERLDLIVDSVILRSAGSIDSKAEKRKGKGTVLTLLLGKKVVPRPDGLLGQIC